MSLNTVFLDVFDLKYLTWSNSNNNNNNNKNNKNIWHLVTLVRADPAAARREYIYIVQSLSPPPPNPPADTNIAYTIYRYCHTCAHRDEAMIETRKDINPRLLQTWT